MVGSRERESTCALYCGELIDYSLRIHVQAFLAGETRSQEAERRVFKSAPRGHIFPGCENITSNCYSTILNCTISNFNPTIQQ